jgi:hypothetical protein
MSATTFRMNVPSAFLRAMLAVLSYVIPDPTKPKTIALVHPFYCEGTSAWTLVIDPLSCDLVPIPFVI